MQVQKFSKTFAAVKATSVVAVALSLLVVFVLGGVLSCGNETVQTPEQTPPPGAAPPTEVASPSGAAPSAEPTAPPGATPPKSITPAPEAVSPEPTPEGEVATSEWEPWTHDLTGAC